MTPTEKHAHCAKILGSAWTYASDVEAETFAEKNLRDAGLADTTPVICFGLPPPGELLFAAGHGFEYKGKKYLFIMINADMRIVLFDELRGLIGHEVAHLVAPRGFRCNDLLQSGNHAAFIECEHEVDAWGEQLAGKGQVSRTLAWVIRYTESLHGTSDPSINAVMGGMRRRIFLLR